MTKVILLMWLADIASSISFIGALSLILATGVAAFGIIRHAINASVGEETEPGYYTAAWKMVRWLLIPGAIALIAPSANTVRLAAAGVAVHEVAQTEPAKKALEAFNATMDKIVKDATK